MSKGQHDKTRERTYKQLEGNRLLERTMNSQVHFKIKESLFNFVNILKLKI